MIELFGWIGRATWHEFFWVCSMLIAIVWSIGYVRDVWSGATRPHTITWLIWGITVGTIFLSQITSGAYLGAGAVFLNTIFCFWVAIFSIIFGTCTITRFDWVMLFLALLSFLLYCVASTPLYAVLLATSTDLIAYGPTFRKSFASPNEETASIYIAGIIMHILSILAFHEHNIVTMIYPVSIVLINSVFITFLLVRRRQLVSASA